MDADAARSLDAVAPGTGFRVLAPPQPVDAVRRRRVSVADLVAESESEEEDDASVTSPSSGEVADAVPEAVTTRPAPELEEAVAEESIPDDLR